MILRNFLKTMPGLAQCPDIELERLAKAMRVETFPAGHTFTYEGRSNHEMFLILEGRVRACHYGEDGNCHDLKFLGSGEFFGLLSLYDHGPASAACIAVEAVKAACLPYLAYQTLIHTSAPIGHYFQLAVAHQLARDLHERSASLRESLKQQIEEIVIPPMAHGAAAGDTPSKPD